MKHTEIQTKLETWQALNIILGGLAQEGGLTWINLSRRWEKDWGNCIVDNVRKGLERFEEEHGYRAKVERYFHSNYDIREAVSDIKAHVRGLGNDYVYGNEEGTGNLGYIAPKFVEMRRLILEDKEKVDPEEIRELDEIALQFPIFSKRDYKTGKISDFLLNEIYGQSWSLGNP